MRHQQLYYGLASGYEFATIADGVEVAEFPELGDRYGVMGVPHTVIDESVHFTDGVRFQILADRHNQAHLVPAVSWACRAHPAQLPLD